MIAHWRVVAFPRCRGTLWNSTVSPPSCRVLSRLATTGATLKPSKNKQKPAKKVGNETHAKSTVVPQRCVPALTGLPMVVYVTPASGLHTSPRIQVSQQYGDRMVVGECFSMTVEDEPRIIGKPRNIKVTDLLRVQDWLLLNKQAILDYWEQRTTNTLVMLGSLKRV